jgi:hypothetical protein
MTKLSCGNKTIVIAIEDLDNIYQRLGKPPWYNVL